MKPPRFSSLVARLAAVVVALPATTFSQDTKASQIAAPETLGSAYRKIMQQVCVPVVGQPTGGALTTVTRLVVPNGILQFPTGLVIAPDGSVPARHRVAPEIEVPNCSVADLIAGRDPQLDAALSALRSH